MKRAVIVIAATIVAASIVLAQPTPADRAAAEADARARAKDYLGAAAKFREAFALDPKPDYICNAAVAYQRAQELPRAQIYLSRCLGTALNDAKFLDGVRAALATIEASLKTGSYTPVDIVVEPRIATIAIDSFAPGETFDGGRTVWLRFGTHRVTVRADGYIEQTVDAHAKDRGILPLRITLEKKPVDVVPGIGSGAGSAVDPGRGSGSSVGSGNGSAAPPVEVRRTAPSKVFAITATIATVALAGVAAFSSVKARGFSERAQFALREDIYNDEADGIERWNTIFGINVALAGVGAVASGYLWYRVVKAPRTEIVPRVGVTGAGATISVGGRF